MLRHRNSDAAFRMSDQNRQTWPDRFSQRFHIFALGESFDVDAFLEKTALRPDFVWHQLGNGPTNGLEFLLGNSNVSKLSEQEAIAIDYMKAHREELRGLAAFPGVDALNLALIYRVQPNTTGVCLGPSRALMFHALDTGVSPNYYVTIAGPGGED
jgi:hypothetical protein